MTEFERAKRRLRKKLKAMLAECEQTIRDCQSWAENRPEHPPMDHEWFVVQAAGIRKSLTALERNEYIDPSWVRTVISLAKNANHD